MKVAVVGASGFIGKAITRDLTRRGHHVVAYVREPGCFFNAANLVYMKAPELGPNAHWKFQPGCEINVLVHAAGRAHIMQDNSADPLREFRIVNVAGTENLARQAAQAGVKRFIYLSSIKVNGEYTQNGLSFTPDDIPVPQDPYAISKHEAENSLHQIAASSSMEVVIIRPPLVYGPGVKANFEWMMKCLYHNVPLPLAAVTNNRRSLVALDNLVNLVVTCLNHPAAANHTFLLSDDEDLSTAELLKRLGAAMGHPASLFYIPPTLLRLGAIALNKPDIYYRLCGSLQLNISKTRQILDWTPSVSVDEGLRRAANGFFQ
jgi:nucleoside-diphosphate-sugar epimerase